MTFGNKPVFDLPSIPIGVTRQFHGFDAKKRKALQRSANNYSVRTDMYFITRCKDEVVYVTRIR